MDTNGQNKLSFCQKCLAKSTPKPILVLDQNLKQSLDVDNKSKSLMCHFEPNPEKIFKCIKCTHHIVHHYPETYKNIEYLIFYEPSEIVSGLYVGSIRASLNLEILNRNKIKHIINCVQDTTQNWINYKQFENINYLNLNIDDDKKCDLLPYFLDIFPIIDKMLEKKENILIHCVRGISRSIAIITGYLMYRFDISFNYAFQIIKNRRHISKPNKNLQKQLLDNSNIIRQLKF